MPLLAVVALATHAAFFTPQPAELRGEALMKALQSGGYTILLRHARTDRSFQEAIGTVPVERSAQRNLSADGVRDAALMRVVLERYRIPIGEIAASPMFRTRETAEYAAGPPTTVTLALRVFPPTEETAAIVSAAPKPGTNRLLVTHHFVIEKYVPGIRPGDIAESEAAIVRPTGQGGVELVGRITLGDWEALAGVVPAPQRLAAPTSPAPSPGTVKVPDTPAGRLALRYLEAFNAGDSSRARAYIESSLLPNATRSTDERIAAWARSYRDLGPLTVTGVRSSSEHEIVLEVRGRERDYRLTAKASAEQPARAVSITIGTAHGGHP